MPSSLGVRLFREPDAGNPPVRFDEREQETGPSQTGLRGGGESRVTRPPGDYSYCACSRLYSPHRVASPHCWGPALSEPDVTVSCHTAQALRTPLSGRRGFDTEIYRCLRDTHLESANVAVDGLPIDGIPFRRFA